MAWIVINGVPPWDGRYEFDVATFDPTIREWGWIKRLAGYMPLTLDSGIEGVDPELIIVLALIAMRRSGKISSEQVPQVYERFQDAPFGAVIRLEVTGEDVEAEDPTTESPPRSSSENGATSGPPGQTSSETSGVLPAPTGMHGSDSSGSA